MKLTLLTNLYPPEVQGGYELLAEDVVRRLRDAGHCVRVLTTGGGPGQLGVERSLRLTRPFGRDAGRDRVRHRLTAWWNRKATETFLARHGRPDAVLAMSQRRLGLEPLRTLQRAGAGTVFTVNDDWPVAYATGRNPGVRGWAAGLIDRTSWARPTFEGMRVEPVVYVSESIRDQVRAAVPQFPVGVVQRQGVDPTVFRPREPRAIRCAPALLFVGRLHPAKMPEVAIDALAVLRRRGIAATLTLAGAPMHPAYGRELRRRARRVGVYEIVRWLGHVPRARLVSEYHAADVVLFFSEDTEAHGLTYLEAMACGVPVVAYPQGGAAELLRAWPAAELATACSGEAVANAIVRLAGDRDLQDARRETSRSMLREAASLDEYVRVLEDQLHLTARPS